MDKLEEFIKNLEYILQCPICLDLKDGKIYQCSHGHLICHGCLYFQKICPLCNVYFSSSPNIVASDVIALMPKIKLLRECLSKEKSIAVATQTSMSIFGTLDAATQTDISDRAEIYQCHIGGCSMNLKIPKLISHIQKFHPACLYKVHEMHEIFREECFLDVEELPRSYDSAFLLHNVGLFFFNAVVQAARKPVVSVKLAGKQSTAQLFNYKIFLDANNYSVRLGGQITSCGQVCKSKSEITPTSMPGALPIKEGDTIKCVLEINWNGDFSKFTKKRTDECLAADG